MYINELWKLTWKLFKKLKIKLLYDFYTTLGHIILTKITHTMEIPSQPMFITKLFTMAKLRHQPRCPLTDNCVKKMWCIYTVEYYPIIKNEIRSFVGTRYHHAKQNKPDSEGQLPDFLSHRI
jgi:hypothetical protein